MQSKEGWIGPQLDNLDHGMPATHQTLEALGGLYMNEKWDITEGSEGTPRISELQLPVDVPMGTSALTSRLCQRAHVPPLPLLFAHPTIISNRLRKLQRSVPTSQRIPMLPSTCPSPATETGLFTDDGDRFPPAIPAVNSHMILIFGPNCHPNGGMTLRYITLAQSFSINQHVPPMHLS